MLNYVFFRFTKSSTPKEAYHTSSERNADLFITEVKADTKYEDSNKLRFVECFQYYEATLHDQLFGDYELTINPRDPSCNQTTLEKATKNVTHWVEVLDEVPVSCLTYIKNKRAAYNPTVRPVLDPTKPVDVGLDTLITQVHEVNGNKQYMMSNIRIK